MSIKHKKRKVYFLGISIIIIIALLIPFVFAISSDQTVKTQSFFSVDSTEKAPGSTLEMYINLNNISYDQFAFTLSNINDVSNLETPEVEGSSGVEVERQNSTITITGNKTEMQVEQIKLSYKVPETLTVGTTLTFNATIENTAEDNKSEENNVVIVNNEIKEDTDEVDNSIKEINDKIENNSQNTINTKQEIQIIIKIVAKVADSNQSQQQGQQNTQSGMQQGSTTGGTQSSSNTPSSNSNKNTSSQQSSGLISGNSQTESVVYNGSSNNYLKKLSITGYDLTEDFTKTNTTYFVTLTDEKVDSLKVSAIAEDDDATVCISGNSELTTGINKILVSVTAENGAVRTYRIYVTK